MRLLLVKTLLLTTTLLAGGSAAASMPVETRTFAFDSTLFSNDPATGIAAVDDNADTLLAYGDGNLTASGPHQHTPSGWTVLVDNDGNGVAKNDFAVLKAAGSDNAGTFAILNDNIWNAYSRVAIGIKVGQKKGVSPDWVIFELEKYALFGNWSTAPAQGGGLSHYLVYGIDAGSISPIVVPVPGAIWLLSTGLVMLLGMGRQRKLAA